MNTTSTSLKSQNGNAVGLGVGCVDDEGSADDEAVGVGKIVVTGVGVTVENTEVDGISVDVGRTVEGNTLELGATVVLGTKVDSTVENSTELEGAIELGTAVEITVESTADEPIELET